MAGKNWLKATPSGQVAEWSNAAVLKTAEGASSPWVRIPPCPPLTPSPFLLMMHGAAARCSGGLPVSSPWRLRTEINDDTRLQLFANWQGLAPGLPGGA